MSSYDVEFQASPQARIVGQGISRLAKVRVRRAKARESKKEEKAEKAKDLEKVKYQQRLVRAGSSWLLLLIKARLRRTSSVLGVIGLAIVLKIAE